MRSIVLANQKGGVGKTTTAIHLAHGFALAGRRTVVIDLDPQGNATVALQGMPPVADPEVLHEAITPIAENLWLLPSLGADTVLPPDAHLDQQKLSDLCADLESKIDWLVIDCPPRMDAWGWTGVRMSDLVVVPVQAEFFAMHGLSQMLVSLETAASEFPGKARFRGVLPTMADLREQVTVEVLEDLRRNLGDRLLRSIVFRDPALVEAASYGRSAFLHCPWSKGALCYAELTKELIDG